MWNLEHSGQFGPGWSWVDSNSLPFNRWANCQAILRRSEARGQWLTQAFDLEGEGGSGWVRSQSHRFSEWLTHRLNAIFCEVWDTTVWSLGGIRTHNLLIFGLTTHLSSELYTIFHKSFRKTHNTQPPITVLCKKSDKNMAVSRELLKLRALNLIFLIILKLAIKFEVM